MQPISSKARSFDFQPAKDENGHLMGITVETINGDVTITEDSYLVYSGAGDVIDICSKVEFDSKYDVL